MCQLKISPCQPSSNNMEQHGIMQNFMLDVIAVFKHLSCLFNLDLDGSRMSESCIFPLFVVIKFAYGFWSMWK